MWDFLNAQNWQVWLLSLGAVVGAVVAALIGHYVIFRVWAVFAKRTSSKIGELAIKHLRRPIRGIMAVFAVRLSLDTLNLPAGPESLAKTVLGIALIVMISSLLIRATSLVNDVILLHFKIDVKDNLRARKLHTQLQVLRRLIVIVIALIASACILMTFPKVRQFGTALLASAGIIGIVVGLAAQKTLGTFIAGLQIAFTQPIRLDDVVIVEGEWGRIEEITLTYVVVRIWDLRRLIVPITYFIEKPFQNWTRVSADILGTVFLYVDHTVPIDAIRTELRRIVEGTEWWDRKVCALEVTNTSERTVELRALMSAEDASLAWTLRCHVREKLVSFVRQNYPHALPRLRAELDKSPGVSAVPA